MTEREKFLLDRLEGIGSSDASVIMGCNKWKTIYELWKEKTEKTLDDKDNDAMAMGRLMEEFVPQIAKKKYPELILNVIVPKNNPYIHPERKYLRANIDFFAETPNGDVVMEIKNITRNGVDNWKNGCPDYYRYQCLHQHIVTGMPVMIVALLAGSDVYVEQFTFTKEEKAEYLDRADDFWYMVENKIQPEQQAQEIEHSEMADKLPVKEAEEKIGLAYAMLMQHKKRMGELEVLMKDCIDCILNEAQNYSQITLNGKPITTWKKRTSLDEKKIPDELKELGYEQKFSATKFRKAYKDCSEFEATTYKPVIIDKEEI